MFGRSSNEPIKLLLEKGSDDIEPNTVQVEIKDGVFYAATIKYPIDITFEEAANKGEQIAAGLASIGIEKGDKVAVISPNCVEWALTDYATVSLGAVLVTVYPSLLKEQVRYILNDSETKAVFAFDSFQTEKINNIKNKSNYASSPVWSTSRHETDTRNRRETWTKNHWRCRPSPWSNI